MLNYYYYSKMATPVAALILSISVLLIHPESGAVVEIFFFASQ